MSKTQKGPGSKKGSGPSRVQAALKEGEPEAKQVEVRGVTFDLPAEMPFAAMLAERSLMKAAEQDNEGAASVAMLDLAIAFVGPQIEKLGSVSVSEGGAALGELLNAIDEAYGVSPGESSASSDS